MNLPLSLSGLKGNKTLRNGSLFSLFSFTNQGINFLLLVWLANYILPDDYGRLSLFNTVVTLLGYFVALSTQGFLGVSYFQRKEKFQRDFTTISLVAVCSTLLFCLLLLFGQHRFSAWTELPVLCLWIGVGVSFFQLFSNMMLDYLRVREKVLKYGLWSCSFALLNFLLTLFLIVCRRMDWKGRVYALGGCTLLFGLLAILLFARSRLFTKHLNWEDTCTVIRWGLPLIPHHAAAWLKMGCDRFIIKHFYSLTEVGVFSFSLNLNSVIHMLGMAFNATHSVSVYQILSSELTPEEKRARLWVQTRSIRRIYTIGCLLVLAGGCLLVPLLLPRYAASVPYFAILSVSGYLQCLYYLYANYLFYYHQNQKIMYVTFVSALCHLGFSLAFTRYSLYLTSCIYVLTQLVVVLMARSMAGRILQKELAVEHDEAHI